MAINDVKITTNSVNAENSIGALIGGTPNSNPIAQLKQVNSIGIENLAEKGVTLPEGLTTCEIMKRIADIVSGGGEDFCRGLELFYELGEEEKVINGVEEIYE